MCLSIPGKLESIENQLDDIFRIGKVAFGEIKKDINLSMVPDAKIGDYVLVHVGVEVKINKKRSYSSFFYFEIIGNYFFLFPSIIISIVTSSPTTAVAAQLPVPTP